MFDYEHGYTVTTLFFVIVIIIHNIYIAYFKTHWHNTLQSEIDIVRETGGIWRGEMIKYYIKKNNIKQESVRNVYKC